MPPPLRSWSLGPRPGRVATEPHPPPRPPLILAAQDDTGNGLTVEVRRLPDSIHGRPSFPSRTYTSDFPGISSHTLDAIAKHQLERNNKNES